ncbi:MAG: hypothetical protein A2X61_06130 [Ignavibacteria bacterium GWB2_35_12]|nr:MAG: hypothetical protein A2X61_06130 [Ignavibacteria bacterium GWB2_35_12]OGU90027.1 MAG: hypothetical protein A2220_05290 [Ignavibacteria bacterium RIFOXYA2_FULL_35_10]OGV21459.1 MAG: hypothetical protein A2475_13710 [Ignavibacteria bacterium RIFOXYC2_FULL_35_21]
MKKAIYLLVSIIILFSSLHSAPVIFKYDNGIPAGMYSNANTLGWDETVMLKPPGPCKINKVQLYLSGTVAAPDTIWVVGDPAEGAYPPSSYCWYINKLADGKIINYTGTPGWYEIDISADNIRADGICSVVIQHRNKQNGPYFTFDNQSQTQEIHSLLVDLRPNPDFLGIRGTIFARSQGNFMVRFEIEYDFPDGETTAQAPPPTLVDVTKEAGLVDGNGSPIKSAMVSVVGFNNNEFEDLAVGSYYFSNNGDATFENKSSQANLQAGQTSWADIDNDGNIDYFALNGGLNDKILFGNGNLSFVDETDSIIKLNQPTVTPMFFDYNHDGLLDLYIAYGRAGDPEVYYPDQLFKNIGNKKFENVTNTAGISAGEPAPYYDCWGASICDYNNDNWPDAFVATYRLAPDMLFRNAKNGMFDEVGGATGARGIPTYYTNAFGHGMGSDWGDFNNDGYDDLCVGNLGHPDERALNSNPSLLFKNDGPPNWTFTDMHSEMGLKFFEMNAGTVWADLNLDGYLDLVHAQYSYDAKGARNDRFTRFYLNQGPSKNFKLKDVTWETGAYNHGAWAPVRLDFDNDGDMDIIVASGHENLKLFRNDLPNKGYWIAFRLSGSPANNVPNEGFGSNVTVYSGGQKFYRSLPGTVMNGRCSQSSNELNFGIGSVSTIDSVVIKFPNGQTNKFTGLAINTKYKIPYMQSPVRMKLTAPMLLSPLNFTTKMVPDVAFDWSQVSEGTKYEILISNKKDFSDTVLHQNELTQTSSNSSTFEINKTYFWKTRAFSDTDTSNWSSIWEFTVGTPTPLAPKLKNPPNDSLNISAKPKFIWNTSEYYAKYPGITIYDLQYSTDPTCSTDVQSFYGLLDTTFLVTEHLIPDTKYYWRTRGINEGQPSQWSEIWNFTVMALPSKPFLTSPANGDTAVSKRPSLSWEESTNADYYTLELSKSEVFNPDSINYQATDITSTSRKLFKSLDEGTIYYWHVRAGNDGGESEWSQTYNFKTEGILGIEEVDNSGLFVKTSPNPFDKVTNIEFYLPEPGFTTLNIFNIEGIELETILSEKLDAGNHLVKWDAKRHPTGIYYFQLIIGNKSYTGKLIVIK